VGEEGLQESEERWQAALRKGFWVTLLACFLFALAAWVLAH
jgi:hypothetical protein